MKRGIFARHRRDGTPKRPANERFARLEVGEGTVVNTDGVSLENLSRIHVTAGRNCTLDLSGISIINSRLTIHMVDDCDLVAGPGQCLNGHVRWYMHEPSSIAIGADCLWSEGDVWTSDMHALVNASTNTRTNPARDVVIGRHVWLAQDFLVLRGSTIGDDSVVATRAVVAGLECPPNSLLAGVPAQIVRRGITWRSELT